MYENAFNTIERNLRAEEGIANELDYVEQTPSLIAGQVNVASSSRL